jgi:hypothetical protein
VHVYVFPQPFPRGSNPERRVYGEVAVEAGWDYGCLKIHFSSLVLG